MSRVCLIVDEMHESIFALLAEAGWEVDYQPKITREEIRAILNKYDGLIIRSKTKVNEELVKGVSRLRFVGRAGAGLDNVDTQYLQSRNIKVLHAAEGNRTAVGEHTVGLLLALLRNIVSADQQVRNFSWLREQNRGMELSEKTVAIIGYGNMGQAFAKCISGFGCKVLAFDKYKTGFSDAYVSEASMNDIVEHADIVSLHVPLTPETQGMVNMVFLKKFKKKIVLLNTARGEIVPLHILAEAIQLKLIRGAALDVLENEKLETLSADQQKAFNYLSTQTNVIFTPHIAGWTFESHEKINVALAMKIKQLDNPL